MIVVSDSTILIGLAKIGKLDLLQKIFSKIYIPEEVYKELTYKGKNRPGLNLSQKQNGLRRNQLKIKFK